MKVLLHTCCAPCLLSPWERLKKENYEVICLFYNPNIQPFQEYEKRLNCLKKFCEENEIKLIEGAYDIDRFFQDVVYRERVRCPICYRLRLTETAKVARRGGFDYFSTTLLVSPFQKHDLIREIGQDISERYDVPFLYLDFRKGWKKAVVKSRKLELYRQQYCGCIYSEKERYYKPHLVGKGMSKK